MSRFHKYSVNNTMLIYLQKPDATLVAGFNKWKDQFGRHVKKGERGIQIIAPTPFLKKTQEPMLDPDTKAPLLDADGNEILEEHTVKIPVFKPVSVFDVSQTEGKPLPQLASTLSGDVQQYEAFLEALRRSSSVPIEFEKMQPGTDGYFSPDQQRIAIREGMSEVQTVSAVIHEMAHSKLHNYTEISAAAQEDSAEAPVRKDRRTEEVEAESVSYAVCQYYGIETAENSFGYIASWSEGKELKELRASLETINKTASGLITDIDRNFAEIKKERRIDKQEAEQEKAEAQPVVPEPAESVEAAAPRELPVRAPMEQLPDHVISPRALEFFGYKDDSMLPVSKDRALELLILDVPVFLIYKDGSDGMAYEPEEILAHDGLFGVTKEDWEAAKAFIPPRDVEQRFVDNQKDSFVIYQLKPTEHDRMFVNFDHLDSPPVREQYEPVYTGALPEGGSTGEKLESLFQTFNLERPADYTAHSMSVGDLVLIKQAGVISAHFCDSVGFVPAPEFKLPENYLRNAEMAMEDDYGMIDGVINNGPRQPAVAELEEKVNAGESISLLDLANAVNAERQTTADRKEKKPSILEQLKAPRVQETPKRPTARRSLGAEMEV